MKPFHFLALILFVKITKAKIFLNQVVGGFLLKVEHSWRLADLFWNQPVLPKKKKKKKARREGIVPLSQVRASHIAWFFLVF